MAPQLDPDTRARLAATLDGITLRYEQRLRDGVLARATDLPPGLEQHIVGDPPAEGEVQRALHALRRTREQ